MFVRLQEVEEPFKSCLHGFGSMFCSKNLLPVGSMEEIKIFHQLFGKSSKDHSGTLQIIFVSIITKYVCTIMNETGKVCVNVCMSISVLTHNKSYDLKGTIRK